MFQGFKKATPSIWMRSVPKNLSNDMKDKFSIINDKFAWDKEIHSNFPLISIKFDKNIYIFF